MAFARDDVLQAVRRRLAGRRRLELENGEGDHLAVIMHQSLILRQETVVLSLRNASGKLPKNALPSGQVAYEILPRKVKVKRTVFGRQQSIGEAQPNELMQLERFVREWPTLP